MNNDFDHSTEHSHIQRLINPWYVSSYTGLCGSVGYVISWRKYDAHHRYLASRLSSIQSRYTRKVFVCLFVAHDDTYLSLYLSVCLCTAHASIHTASKGRPAGQLLEQSAHLLLAHLDAGQRATSVLPEEAAQAPITIHVTTRRTRLHRHTRTPKYPHDQRPVFSLPLSLPGFCLGWWHSGHNRGSCGRGGGGGGGAPDDRLSDCPDPLCCLVAMSRGADGGGGGGSAASCGCSCASVSYHHSSRRNADIPAKRLHEMASCTRAARDMGSFDSDGGGSG
mmetsp:Transcript_10488/g.25394  ORF Transcript_10488/g.25394 Transcript_10488/m.25394 type:complete len:279 (-) Transcript_10488:827-1663(-)